jgi:hypothetical protein
MVRSLASERASLSEAQAEIERLRLIIKKLQRSQFGRRPNLRSATFSTSVRGRTSRRRLAAE